MPDELRVERAGSGLTIVADETGPVILDRNAAPALDRFLRMSPDDLHWLVTTGGPAMIALLGGPLAIKGATAPGEVGQHG